MSGATLFHNAASPDVGFFLNAAQIIQNDFSRAPLSAGQPVTNGTYASLPHPGPSNSQNALVLCGPIVGTVTATSANVLLEVNMDSTVTATAQPDGVGMAVSCTRNLKRCSPDVFNFQGLSPGTKYRISFGPLAPVQMQELQEKGCIVCTLQPDNQMQKLRIIALSCDRPRRLLEGQENPWDRVAAVCKSDGCDVMLHLGDQVYTKEADWMDAAKRIMDVCEKPGIDEEVRMQAEADAAERLQQAYRATWYPTSISTVLSRSSHLMIWSDNDVANDFTVLKKADGSQAYTPSFLRVAMRVYRMYQRQLWDPDCVISQQKLEALPEVEEWHFHRYGPCGIFLIDMRGNRITPTGFQKEGPILSARQRAAIEDAFSQTGLTCMLVCSEIPFVGDPPDVIRNKAKKLTFLTDHWPYQLSELIWLLDLCFAWKVAAPGREVIMIGGDIHVSVDSTIMDRRTGQSIRHITTSPITNHVCGFYPELSGNLSDRYSYTHTPMPGMRTYCTIDLTFVGHSGSAHPQVNLVGIPMEKDSGSEKPEDALVLCGPVVGTVTENSANILIEVDADLTLTCKAMPATVGAELVSDTRKMTRARPEVFKLEGLLPNTEYNITFDPLATLQSQELRQRGCVVRTMPSASQISQLRVIALSCDRPARMHKGQENPWGRLAEICKSGGCDVMLHLGDQVYTKENDWKASAVRVMDICEKPGITDSLRRKMESEAAERLQMAYRATWYPDEVATVLSRSSHLMIWSDNDVANDFTILKKKDGSQAYTPQFIRVGMRVYRMYQRQLWDPDCVISQKKLEDLTEVEEWHFHRYGPCGVFLIDMRGNRIRPDGIQKEGPILSERQKQAIQQAFAEIGLTCMLVCSEIPFVGDPPDVIRKKAEKLTFLKDHWPYQIAELTWLLDLCFSWKSAVPGREVIMLGGDIHVSVDSMITDRSTGQTIRHITTSPITNHVCPFFPDLEGSLNDRYSYVHKPLPGMRTYCTIDLSFVGSSTSANINLVGVPVPEGEDD